MWNPSIASWKDVSLPPFPDWAQIVIFATIACSITLPAGIIRMCVGISIFCWLFYLTVSTSCMNSRGEYAALCTCVGLMYRWIDLFAIHVPERDFWLIKKNGEKIGVPNSTVRKICWFTSIVVSNRMVGTNAEVKHIPKIASARTRTQFLAQSTLHMIWVYIWRDIAATVGNRLRLSIPPSVTFYSAPLLIQIAFSWAQTVNAYHTIDGFYTAAGMFSVAACLTTPCDWPAMYLPFWSNFYSIRKAWGNCWHQLMRRPGEEGGRIFCNIFGIQKGSFASRYCKLWIAFFISWFMHHPSAVRFDDCGLSQFAFFLSQPAAIMLEDSITELGRRFGFRDGRTVRWIGMFSTTAWFSLSIRWCMAGQPRAWNAVNDLPSLFSDL